MEGNGEDKDDIHGMRELWGAVITQMLMDAGSRSRKPERIRDRIFARRWLFSREDQGDFEFVCHMAGRNPTYVRRKAREAMLRGFVWRNDYRGRVEVM